MLLLSGPAIGPNDRLNLQPAATRVGRLSLNCARGLPQVISFAQGCKIGTPRTIQASLQVEKQIRDRYLETCRPGIRLLLSAELEHYQD